MTFAHGKNQVIELKCPQCSGVCRYNPKKIQFPLYHHVYKCLRCKAEIACPTEYSLCGKYGMIAKDLKQNDCLMCPVPKLMKFDPKNAACPHYQGKIPYPELVIQMNKKMKDERITEIIDREQYPRR